MRLFLWFLGALLVALFASQLPWARVAMGQNDFLQLYGGAQLVGTGLLHDATAMEQVHRQATGAHLPAVQYVRPDYYAVLLQPLGHLPYRAAYALFQLFNLLALIAVWRLLSPGTPGRWLVSLSIPLLVCFVNGQDVALFLLCVIAAFHFSSHRPLLAGALLAFATIKPHFLVFLPFTLLFFARWRIIAAGLTTLTALIALAASTEGWAWLLRFPSVVLNPVIHPEPFQFLNLRGILTLLPATAAPLLYAASAALLLFGLWQCRQRQHFSHAFALSLAGAVFLSHHLGLHDCLLLLPAAALANPQSWLQRGLLALSLPLTYWLLMFDAPFGALPALTLAATLTADILHSVKFSPSSLFRSTPPIPAR